MAKARIFAHAFNVGVHDSTALARIDLERLRLAAEVQTNWLPMAVGPAFLRPGLGHIGALASVTRIKDFVFGATDAAVMEFGNQTFRVRINDQVVSRVAVSTLIQSGGFLSSTGWTLVASSGAVASVAGGYLNLTALPRGGSAYARQTVTVAVGDRGKEHGLRITIDRGPVTFTCGSSEGADDYIGETELRTGVHSIAFTPVDDFYIEFRNETRNLRRVEGIAIEGVGAMNLATQWSSDDLGLLRFAQSADVVFVTANGYPPKRIERRSNRSWSVVTYAPDDGPFTVARTRKLKLRSSVTEGNGSLTADRPFFTASHVGSLFKIFNEGQKMTFRLGADGVTTEPFRVSGINDGEIKDRIWGYTLSGTWSAQIWTQRTFDEIDSGYVDYVFARDESLSPVTTNGTRTQQDGDDNAIIYYRLAIKDGDYSSGFATVETNYQGGGGYGICRVVGYTSSTVVDIEVLRPFRNTTFTDNWQEGEWSAHMIWPSAVCFADGRLFLSGSDRLWGSVSDAFDSFDEEFEGEAGPISRSIATGGVNATQWLTAPQRLLIGTEGTIAVAKSSSLDEPLTPDSISIRDSSTTGAAPVDPARIDNRVLFTDRSGKAIYELVFDGSTTDYTASQMSKMTTDIFASGVKEIAVQRRPDTRVWVVMNDGSCACILYEPSQEVMAFVPIETAGLFESVAVVPGATQDAVYFVVARVTNGLTVRSIEKMALDSEVKPGTLAKVMDGFVTGTNGPASTTINVGSTLEGKTIVAWADGAPVETAPGVRGEFVVSGGAVTLPYAVTNWVAGLPYTARYKSARLAYGVEGGTAMMTRGTIDEFGLLLADCTRNGIKVGSDFENLYNLPQKGDGGTIDAIVTGVLGDGDLVPFGGAWKLDSRFCMEISSPYTAKALGLVIKMQANG